MTVKITMSNGQVYRMREYDTAWGFYHDCWLNDVKWLKNGGLIRVVDEKDPFRDIFINPAQVVSVETECPFKKS